MMVWKRWSPLNMAIFGIYMLDFWGVIRLSMWLMCKVDTFAWILGLFWEFEWNTTLAYFGMMTSPSSWWWSVPILPPPKDQTWWLPQQRIGTPALDIYVVQTPEASCSKGGEATCKSYRSSNHCKWVQLCPHESKIVSKPVPPWICWWYILS